MPLNRQPAARIMYPSDIIEIAGIGIIVKIPKPESIPKIAITADMMNTIIVGALRFMNLLLVLFVQVQMCTRCVSPSSRRVTIKSTLGESGL
jgi:hypothetical protein